MKTRIRCMGVLAAGAVGTVLAGAAPVAAEPQGPLAYAVTVTNLTANQWFTPPVVTTHLRSTAVFAVGSPASEGVKEVAENGNVPALVDELNGNPAVRGVVAGAGPLGPGQSVSFEISGKPGRALSVVSMLICTNDGFTGVDGLRLPADGSLTVMGDAYDAGTEINTEDLADIVPPCQALNGVPDDEGAPGTGVSDPALAEGGVIDLHDGIQGGIADLTVADHGWSDPVVEIDVTRLG